MNQVFRNQTRALFAIALVSLSLTASAVSFECPDLSAAVQVNACPTEDELKYTYLGFCGDDKKAYSKETADCVRYEDYRAKKNQALWESKDGEFMGYVSCDLPVGQVKSLKSTGIKLEKKGTITSVVCSYPNGVTFSYRTKAKCSVKDTTVSCE